ncbi:MAG TPA: MerR family transcriptional regulator [Actinomycetota bacterium]|jgi:DNA-binding transcriptional MerR regulator|nr:MerR family transcriptional regulator [Actinomycetota bacterium]
MPLARARDYLSIGEVLDLLRPDFPDVSISKIRFLEAEGLIAPERTGAKYRKFYDGDVARLRYILALQRDHFLPLRVIKERLAQASPNGGDPAPLPPVAAPPAAGEAESATVVDLTGVQLSKRELESASELGAKQLHDLIDFGILAERESYDENDLAVAKAAARFMTFGVEARHLRMFKQTAEREAAFVQQIVLPLSRRHDREAADEATARSVRELVALSRQVREALLRAALQDLL